MPQHKLAQLTSDLLVAGVPPSLVMAHRDAIKRMMPTDKEVALFKMMGRSCWNSHQVGVAMKISTQQASNLLASLFKKGHLERETFTSPTGGLEHQYSVKN